MFSAAHWPVVDASTQGAGVVVAMMEMITGAKPIGRTGAVGGGSGSGAPDNGEANVGGLMVSLDIFQSSFCLCENAAGAIVEFLKYALKNFP